MISYFLQDIDSKSIYSFISIHTETLIAFNGSSIPIYWQINYNNPQDKVLADELVIKEFVRDFRVRCAKITHKKLLQWNLELCFPQYFFYLTASNRGFVCVVKK